MPNAELITKYRPVDFDEVIGQDSVVASLRQAIEKQTSRAFLFCGPSGVGKTTLGRITAQALGCLAENIVEVDAATHTGVDAMRSLLELVQYRPLTASSKRAVIVDECHAISGAAWKSLLKSVEEPPPDLYWIFCTTDPDKVLPTIRTRCAYYGLKLVKLDDLLDLLEAIVDLEHYTLSPQILQIVAREAHGSPRQALANLAVCAFCVTEAEALDLLEAVQAGDKDVLELCRALVKGSLTWPLVQAFLKNLEGKDSESIRQAIVGYLLTVLKGTQHEETTIRTLALLSQFSDSWVSDRTQPVSLCLALGRCLYTD